MCGFKNTSPAFPVRCFKPFITNHRHYYHHHQLRSTARGWGRGVHSIPFTRGKPNRWLARAATARVDAPSALYRHFHCTLLEKKREEGRNSYSAQHLEAFYQQNRGNRATQSSESPIKKLQNSLSVNSSLVFSHPKKELRAQRSRSCSVSFLEYFKTELTKVSSSPSY